MVEEVEDSDYKRYIHFLSVSTWSASAVNNATLRETDKLLRGQNKRSDLPTGLVLDETSHLKKGSDSVGVARQYAGVAGKVDNCQVAVHASLANGKFCTLVGTELFLPEGWTKDKQRCKGAGIPNSDQKFQTKPELALKLIKQIIQAGTEFDFIGGDGYIVVNDAYIFSNDGYIFVNDGYIFSKNGYIVVNDGYIVNKYRSNSIKKRSIHAYRFFVVNTNS